MASINFSLRRIPQNLWLTMKAKWFKFKISVLSLCYHEHFSLSYVIDILMEPMLWFVDNFTKCLGPIFVVGVVGLTTSVVFLCFVIGLPFWWKKDPFTTIILYIVGHWLLINVAFHYYMGCTVSPGLPPEGSFIPEAVSICKKCISPKPPRTHHCSVCNKCILKMDHHCPWLNNCVGFYNHRHFFLYMVYTALGVLFIIIFGFDLFLQRVWFAEEELEGHPVGANNLVIETAQDAVESSDDPDKWHRGAIIYMSLICCGVFIALTTLSIWHARLISRGETSIEANINKAEMKRYAARNELYVNPYNLGWRRNWSYFLGVDRVSMFRAFLMVLFPSPHLVTGTGLTWPSIFSDDLVLKIEKVQ